MLAEKTRYKELVESMGLSFDSASCSKAKSQVRLLVWLRRLSALAVSSDIFVRGY